MDQMRAEFRVASAAGRDVRPEDVGAVAETLDAWAERADRLSAALGESKAAAKGLRDDRKASAEALAARVEEAKKSLSAEGADHGALDAMDVDRPLSKRRGKRSRAPFKSS